MVEDREIDQLRQEMVRLHERANENKAAVAAAEAVSEERYDHILKMLDDVKRDIKRVNHSVSNLETLATQGKTSLKTILWLGGATSALAIFILSIMDYFNK
jgi:CRISPR/Cas system CMR subunit Cmr6 (Cas7 group RAMP superfamily)